MRFTEITYFSKLGNRQFFVKMFIHVDQSLIQMSFVRVLPLCLWQENITNMKI